MNVLSPYLMVTVMSIISCVGVRVFLINIVKKWRFDFIKLKQPTPPPPFQTNYCFSYESGYIAKTSNILGRREYVETDGVYFYKEN